MQIRYEEILNLSSAIIPRNQIMRSHFLKAVEVHLPLQGCSTSNPERNFSAKIWPGNQIISSAWYRWILSLRRETQITWTGMLSREWHSWNRVLGTWTPRYRWKGSKGMNLLIKCLAKKVRTWFPALCLLKHRPMLLNRSSRIDQAPLKWLALRLRCSLSHMA